VPSLFRRRPTDLVADAVDDAELTADADNGEDAEQERPRRHTPSKRELGVVTPKRTSAQRRRGPEPPPANRREAARRMRERRREQRSESLEGMRRGDERYLLPRDRGPERALVRNIVDSRRTVGTWFFGGALIVLIGSSAAMPPAIRLVANLLWALLALGVVLDAILISRKIKKLIGERFPDTTQRPRSLYLYGIMRSITFRRMRMPKPRVDIGEAV
jgi:Protein of unknown function (DUF3043)